MNLSRLIILCFFITSCSELTGSDTGANNISVVNNLVTIGGVQAIQEGGSKFLLDGSAAGGVESGHNFKLKFRLPNSKKAKFIFFMRRDFSGGAEYIFSREENKVYLEVRLDEVSDKRELSELNDSEIIDITLDVHNNETDAHMLVWKANGPYGNTDECMDEVTPDGVLPCLYNTDSLDLFDIWVGHGRASGPFWGYEGDKGLIVTLEGMLEPISDV